MSCLFDSVSSYTRNCSSGTLRQMVADYLASNPVFWGDMGFEEVFRMFDAEDVHYCRSVQQYVASMRQSSTWGGAIEIQAMCNMFSIQIRVHVVGSPQSRPIEFTPAASGRAAADHALDITWNGNHFESLAAMTAAYHHGRLQNRAR